MSRVASEATDRPSLTHASEVSEASELTASKTFDEPQDPLDMSRVASEATDRLSLTHASEASERPYREQDVDEPQDPLAMTEPLTREQSKRPT